MIRGDTLTEAHDLEPLRRRLFEYYKTYYAELRRLVTAQPAYKSDPDSFPYHLRDHPRVIQAAECADGYGVIHLTAPEGRGYAFEVDDNKGNWTVGELTKYGFAPHSDFFEWRIWVTREKGTDEYTLPKKRQERIDAISYSRVATLTPDKARAAAKKMLRDFLERPDSPFFKNLPHE
jgi:hypothetical protein